MAKFNKSIFVKVDQNSLLTEDRNKKPILEEEIKTLQLQKTKSGYKLYKLNRKEPKIFIQNIKTKKSEKEIIKDINENKIFIKSKNEDIIKGSNKEFKITQSNYILKRNQHQLVCLVQVSDSRRKIIDNFIGFSKKFESLNPTKSNIYIAKNQCIKMAIGKFISIYGTALKSGDIDAVIIQQRYQYYN